VLQASVDLHSCEPCFCDVDSSGEVTATDALIIVRKCVDLPVDFVCP
jgi:hypothetical protein